MDYLSTAALSKRKRLGQYFTPAAIREALVERLPRRNYRRVLDPGAGTGEILLSVQARFPDAELFGWDIDPEVLRVSRKILPGEKLSVRDFIRSRSNEKFDLVIGNPPYFEFKPDDALRSRYAAVISGRPNIFAFFFKAGLDLLNEGGVLAYIVPTSMNNGAYFSALRDLILRTATIHSLDIVAGENRFVDAQQSVMAIILIKSSRPARNTRFVFGKNSLNIFSRDSRKLEALYAGRQTLREMGFRVATGRVVWNQRRKDLTDDPKGAVPLLWTHNVGENGELIFPVTEEKPQYVRNAPWSTGPAIIVNRITGAGEKASLRAAYVPAGMKFVGENHVNVITASERAPTAAYKAVIAQLHSARTRDFARLLTGNTQISKTELERIIPFDPV